MQLVLATHNKGKIREILKLLDGVDVSITSLGDQPEVPDIVEDGLTFLENARKKAHAVARAADSWALADDSGLEVCALGGKPGIHSARYAGRQGDNAANNRKLLEEMRHVPDGERQAAFVCVMVLAAPDGREWAVEGRCEGEIGRRLKGTEGFGFDPLFYLPQESKTMAELPLERKNALSHRGQALRKIREVVVEIAKGAKDC